jgi:Fe-S cluster assembly scaffold protein SufB
LRSAWSWWIETAAKVLAQLPMEFAVEAQKLISISLEGSVG